MKGFKQKGCKLMKNIFLVSAFVMLLCGCTATPDANTIQNRASVVAPESKEVKEFDNSTQDTAIRAQKIANIVSNIDGVEKSSVVITGDTAIIGIELVGELEDRKLIKLKTEVEKEVKKADASLDHVAVTAAAELVKRITNVSDSVSSEDTVPKTDSRIEKIIRRFTPPL